MGTDANGILLYGQPFDLYEILGMVDLDYDETGIGEPRDLLYYLENGHRPLHDVGWEELSNWYKQRYPGVNIDCAITFEDPAYYVSFSRYTATSYFGYFEPVAWAHHLHPTHAETRQYNRACKILGISPRPKLLLTSLLTY